MVSILCIVIGVLFCIWPGTMLIILCRLVGAVLAIAGAVLMITALRLQEMMGRSVRLVPGLICLIIGLWVLARPGNFVVLIPIFTGILMLYHGIKDISFCLEVKRGTESGWAIGLLFAIATFLLGLFLIIYSWPAVKMAVVFGGIVLIYDGVSGLWLNHKASRSGGGYRKDEPIDVDYKEE